MVLVIAAGPDGIDGDFLTSAALIVDVDASVDVTDVDDFLASAGFAVESRGMIAEAGIAFRGGGASDSSISSSI